MIFTLSFILVSSFSSFASIPMEEVQLKDNKYLFLTSLHSDAENTISIYNKKRENHLQLLNKMLSLNKKEAIQILLEDFKYSLKPTTDINNKESLNELYKKPDVEQIISFIKKSQINNQQSFILLIPFLTQKNTPPPMDIVQMLKETHLSPNTTLKAKDIITLLPLSDIENYIDPELTITSLAHLITLTKNKESIKYIYSLNDFDPNQVDEIGRTPLHLLFTETSDSKTLSKQDWKEILISINKNPNTDINKKDSEGFTPLALATTHGYLDAIKMLLKNPKLVTINTKNNFDKTPLDIAATSEHKESDQIYDLLKSKGQSDLLKKTNPSLLLAANSNIKNGQADLKVIENRNPHPLMEVFGSSVKILEQQKSNGIQIDKDQKHINKLFISFKESLENQNNLLRLFRNPETQIYKKLYLIKSIEDNDIQSLQDFKNKDFLNNLLLMTDLFTQNDLENKKYLVKSHNFLLHAILSNSPQSVKYLLNNLENAEIFQPQTNNPEYKLAYMDPLSESLFALGTLKSHQRTTNKKEEIESALKIIQLLIKHKKVITNKKNFMGLTPLEVSILIGHTGITKELLKKEKSIKLPEKIWGTTIDYINLTNQMGLKEMSEFLQNEALKKPTPKTSQSKTNKNCKTSFKKRN